MYICIHKKIHIWWHARVYICAGMRDCGVYVLTHVQIYM